MTIKVFNKTRLNHKINNVEWNNINSISSADQPDVLISMSDANLLNLFKCKKNFLWSHSIQSIEKFIRKKQLIPYLKNRPTFLLLGTYHKNEMSPLCKLFGSKIIDYGLDEIFLNSEINYESEEYCRCWKYICIRKSFFSKNKSQENI